MRYKQGELCFGDCLLNAVIKNVKKWLVPMRLLFAGVVFLCCSVFALN